MGATTTAREPAGADRPAARKYRAMYAKGEFNRRVHRLIAILAKAREELLDLAEGNGDSVGLDWLEAGLPRPEGPERELLDESYEVAAAAGGCAWAVGSYLEMLEGHAVPIPGRRR
ncbi:hypothetical protein [Gemmata sp.]|uniref:hypothetical protein n=1 Tax=Gemmata sp. TaxID=1914242 RepID=UPI003F6F9099